MGEGTVSAIGSAGSHKEVLENPDNISKRVLSGGLDSGTAFEILSIDIADIDVGRNIGAKLQTEQAEADKVIAQARAEQRRAAAVALEQEMSARVERCGPRVVSAEAKSRWPWRRPSARATWASWNYYRMRNVQADTSMRESLGNEATEGGQQSV